MDYHKMNQIHMTALSQAVLELMDEYGNPEGDFPKILNRLLEGAIATVEQYPDHAIIPSESVREACRDKEVK